jgi:hypothetical protein
MSQTQGQWVIANIYTGAIAPETARYASADQAGQVLRELVQQGRLEEGNWEIRPAPPDGDVAPALTPDEF